MRKVDFRGRLQFRWVSQVVILLAVAACGADLLLGPDAPQGVEGIVLVGPQCPVQSNEDPCPDLPYRAWIRIRRGDGSPVARIRSDQDGLFRVGLRPGPYVLDPESGDPFPRAEALDVEVEAGMFTSVTIHFDTGIR